MNFYFRLSAAEAEVTSLRSQLEAVTTSEETMAEERARQVERSRVLEADLEAVRQEKTSIDEERKGLNKVKS